MHARRKLLLATSSSYTSNRLLAILVTSITLGIAGSHHPRQLWNSYKTLTRRPPPHPSCQIDDLYFSLNSRFSRSRDLQRRSRHKRLPTTTLISQRTITPYTNSMSQDCTALLYVRSNFLVLCEWNQIVAGRKRTLREILSVVTAAATAAIQCD